VALAALNRSRDAEKAFTRAIELRKDWVLPYGALGNLLTRQSRDKEAEPFLRRALQLGAKDFGTLASLSAVRFRAGDTKKRSRLRNAHLKTKTLPPLRGPGGHQSKTAAGIGKRALSSLETCLAA